MGNTSRLSRAHTLAWICLGMALALLAIGAYIAVLRSSSPAAHRQMDSALIEQAELTLRADTILVTGTDTMRLAKPKKPKKPSNTPSERRLPATRDYLNDPVPAK